MKTYLDYYECVSENLPEADEAEIDWKVRASIKEDFDAGRLDTSLDPDDEVEDQDQEKLVPKVELWYGNAITKYLWDNASPSQREAVEQKRKEENEKIEGWKKMGVPNYDADEDDAGKMKRLQAVVEFVVSQIW